MNNPKSWLKVTLILLNLSFVFPLAAHAYFDPGTGNYILQLLLGTALGTIIAFRRFWTNLIKRLLRILPAKQQKEDTQDK